ncbi:MAG TPA: T9SS type A sorting domain-containing protein [Puia sp.]
MFRPLPLTLIILTLTLSSVGQTFLQSATTYQHTNSKTISQAFGATSKPDDLIIVHLDYDNTAASVNTVTDNKGNTYTRISGPTTWNGTFRAELWYAYAIAGSPTITVTAKLSAAPTTYSQIYITEYKGIASSIDPLDQHSESAGNTSAVSSGAKTTTYTNELIFGVSIGASGTLTTGAGFNPRSTVNQNVVEDKSVVSIGSYNTAFTSASGNWVAQMATFISTISTLPVDFSALTADCSNDQVTVNWAAASETNNNYFTIEESTDGSSWAAIGQVKSHINSGVDQDYSYTAKRINGNAAFFRIKQTDLDGDATYSRIIRAGNCSISLASNAANIYPNPSAGTSLAGRIVLQPGQTCFVEVFDIAGRRMNSSKINQSEFTIGFPQLLPPGLYYARFSMGGSSTTASFVVKH